MPRNRLVLTFTPQIKEIEGASACSYIFLLSFTMDRPVLRGDGQEYVLSIGFPSTTD